jgi:hypothetical protein
MSQVREAVAPDAALAWMEKMKAPAAEGVPPMEPVEAASDKPGGRSPPVTDHAASVAPSKVAAETYG